MHPQCLKVFACFWLLETQSSQPLAKALFTPFTNMPHIVLSAAVWFVGVVGGCGVPVVVDVNVAPLFTVIAVVDDC